MKKKSPGHETKVNLSDNAAYEFGPFRLEPAPVLRLTRDGKEVCLTRKGGKRKALSGIAFKMLLTFVRRYDQVVTKRDWEVALWNSYQVDAGLIAQHVKTIRKFLGDDPDAPEYVVTVPGEGYRFIKPVREVPMRSDSGAEQLYTDGLGYLYTFATEDQLRRAISCFKQAYTDQPDYAPALVAAAEAHIWLCFFSWEDAKAALTVSMELADKAHRLDPTLGDAEATYALAELILRRNWEQALTVFERVLRQNPMSQAALRGYALWLMANARFADAFKKIDRALVVSRKSFLNIGIMCMVLYASGAGLDSLVPAPSAERPGHDSRRLVYDFMMRVTEEQSELKVDAAWYILGLFYERAGWHERAIKALSEAMSEGKLAGEKFLGHLVLAYIYAVAGQVEAARRLLDKLMSLERWVSPFHFALIELALGNREEAKWYLDDAIARCDPWACLLIDPRLKDLRDDPEFLDMFRRINLDPNLLRKVS